MFVTTGFVGAGFIVTICVCGVPTHVVPALSVPFSGVTVYVTVPIPVVVDKVSEIVPVVFPTACFVLENPDAPPVPTPIHEYPVPLLTVTVAFAILVPEQIVWVAAATTTVGGVFSVMLTVVADPVQVVVPLVNLAKTELGTIDVLVAEAMVNGFVVLFEASVNVHS